VGGAIRDPTAGLREHRDRFQVVERATLTDVLARARPPAELAASAAQRADIEVDTATVGFEQTSDFVPLSGAS